MLNDVFEILADPVFQKPGPGLMSFPAYVYVYPPDEEYPLRKALPHLVERLKRPSVGQEALLTDIYAQFRSYLSQRTLGERSLLNRLQEAEEDDPEKVDDRVKSHARSEEFVEFVAEPFMDFVVAESDRSRTYVACPWLGIDFPVSPGPFSDGVVARMTRRAGRLALPESLICEDPTQ